MKIFVSDQTHNLPKHLSVFKNIEVNPYDKKKLKEKVTSIRVKNNSPFEELDLNFLFDYKIFPEQIITAYAQWNDENRSIKEGDTIVQQAFIPPYKLISIKIIFAVRVLEVFSDSDLVGFSYETLKGHVEKGISTFTIQKDQDTLIFKVHTFSKPGNFLSKLVGPIFSIPYQTYCTNKCLRNVAKKLTVQSKV